MTRLRRVLLAEEDPLARMGLARVLAEADGWTVVDGIEDAPDAAVADVSDDSLLESVRTLAESYPVLALLPDSQRARETLSAGARGVIARNVTGRRLARALDAVVEGFLVIDEGWIDELLRPPRRTLEAGEELTPRELEVLECLALGLSNKEIASRLGVSFHTVKFHVNSILGKLSAASRTEAVALAARAGLLAF
jgi:two-component system nitrate/nitrite response regulator NarL